MEPRVGGSSSRTSSNVSGVGVMAAVLEPQRGFHVVDYVVMGVVIAVSLGIGVFHAVRGKRNNNPDGKSFF